MASLFAAGEKGGYYNFTDLTKLAINGDGTGGSPAVGGTAKWAIDLSPNANHLRNTVSTVSVVSNGIVTSGTNYGLFNLPNLGGWVNIPAPFEIIATMEQKAFAVTDAFLIGSTASHILQGSASGKVRTAAGSYGIELTPGLLTEFTLDCYFNGASSLIGLNGGAMAANAMTTAAAFNQAVLGSNDGGGLATNTRFKRLLIVGRALTTAERAGAVAWASA